MAQFDIEFFNDVFYNKKLTVLDRFFKGLLNMPKHQVLHLSVFAENLLETIEVATFDAADKCASPGHKLHELGSVLFLQGLDFTPKTQNKKES